MQIEYARSEPSEGRQNEDSWGQNGTCVWLMDGATDLLGTKVNGVSSARWFVDTLHEQLISKPAPQSGEQFRLDLIEAVRHARNIYMEQFRDTGDLSDLMPSATLTVIVEDADKIELIALGDSRILFTSRDGIEVFGNNPVEKLDDQVLEKMKLMRAAQPNSTLEEIRMRLSSDLRANRRLMNQPMGYPIMSLEPNSLDQLQYRSIERSDFAHNRIIMASDGFLRLVEVYGALNYADLLMCEPEQLDQLFSELRAIEKGDEEGHQFPRLKSQDDATCLSISL